VSAAYDALIASNAPQFVVLVEPQPAERLGPFVLDSGHVYKLTWPQYVQTSVVSGGLYRRLDGVRENGTAYTEVFSVPACEALAGSYYFYPTDNILYVHTTTGSNPKVFAFVGAWFTLPLSTATISFSDQSVYYPLVTGALPSWQAEMPDDLFGVTTSDTGQVSLLNGDGLFDRLSRQWIWRNKQVTSKLGGVGLAYTDFQTIATMRINRMDPGDGVAALTLEQQRSLLNQSLPRRTWGDGTDFAATNPSEAGALGLSQPLIFGTVEDCPLVLGNRDGTDYWYAFDQFDNGTTLLTVVVAVERATGARTTLTDGIDYTLSAFANFIRVINASYLYETHDIIATIHNLATATFGSIAQRILVLCGESTDNIDTAAFTAADTAAPQVLARFLAAPIQAADLLRSLEQSVNGQVYVGADGRWTCRVFDPSVPSTYTSLSDADFASWEPTEDLASVLNTIRARHSQKPFKDDWIEVSGTNSAVLYGSETSDSHRFDTWLTTSADASVLVQHHIFFRGVPECRIAFEERGLSLMGASVGDLVKVTRARAPVGRTGRYEGQFLRILSLTKRLGPDAPTVSGVLGDLHGRADEIFRLAPASSSLDWSSASAEDKALYGFLSDADEYIDSTDSLTYRGKALW
jgi:hypothetical protein